VIPLTIAAAWPLPSACSKLTVSVLPHASCANPASCGRCNFAPSRISVADCSKNFLLEPPLIQDLKEADDVCGDLSRIFAS
jgi:hypothetical protein